MTKQIGLTLDAATAARVFPDGEITIPKALDDLIRLLVTDLHQFIREVSALPLDDHRREAPAKVPPQGLVGRAVVVFEPPGKSPRVIDGPISADDRVIGYRGWHLMPC